MNTKSIFTSVTFWGAVTSLASVFFPKLLTAFGVTAPTAATDITMGVGFLITVYGRLRATQVATVTGTPTSTSTLTK